MGIPHRLQEKCLFCEPEAHDQANQVLLRSDNFFLFAGIGPMIEGYIIIAPHRCDRPDMPFRSFSDIPPDLLDEVVFLRALVSKFYRDFYNQEASMHFEHGRTGVCYPRSDDTKHCYHAHLCCYPCSFPLWEDFMNELEVKKIEGLIGLKEAVGDNPYLLIQSSFIDRNAKPDQVKREQWVSNVTIIGPSIQIPSQYLRRLLAARLGNVPTWDWVLLPQMELVKKLIVDFQTWLQSTNRYELSQDGDSHVRLDYLKSVERSNRVGNDDVASDFHRTWVGRTQYDVIGRFLSKLPKLDKEPGENLLRRIKILDVGCGPGHYLKVFAALGFECVGIDISEEMVKIAKQLVDTGSVRNETGDAIPVPQIETASLFDLNFDTESFDAIWYSATVVHVPRRALPSHLSCLHRILKKNGVLYISALLGSGSVVRREGRVFFYYGEEELKTLFDEANFKVVEEWSDTTGISSRGDQREKSWKHFFLKKKDELSHLGEQWILKRIQNLIPEVKQEHVLLGIGDDCAAIRPIKGEVIVLTTDPCPKPVISLLGEADHWYDGWFTMIINLSDLGAMGAKPLGMLLALEAENEMKISELDRFYEGVLEASRAYDCPVIGGNVKDAPRFNCIGTAIGSVRPEKMLRRDAARPGEKVVVIGEMGLFWAGVIHKLAEIPLALEESTFLLEPLRRPRPKVFEGRALAERGLARCAIDSSDGLNACFYEIARRGKDVDLHLNALDPHPLVKRIAENAQIDVRKLLLSWGNWELVTTIAEEDLAEVQKLMSDIGCSVSIVGEVKEGKGNVWLDGDGGQQRLNYVASERFTRRSYFSHGLEGYLRLMREEPLTC